MVAAFVVVVVVVDVGRRRRGDVQVCFFRIGIRRRIGVDVGLVEFAVQTLIGLILLALGEGLGLGLGLDLTGIGDGCRPRLGVRRLLVCVRRR